MAEPILDAPRVVAGIGQRVAAGVPEHVNVDRKGEAGAPALAPRRRAADASMPAVLGAADVQRRDSAEIDLRPLHVRTLGGARNGDRQSGSASRPGGRSGRCGRLLMSLSTSTRGRAARYWAAAAVRLSEKIPWGDPRFAVSV
jgi:hypothetical protein